MPDNGGIKTTPRRGQFDPHWYLAAYPDVVGAGMDPWDHYDRFGRAEGRLPHAIPVAPEERDLWTEFAHCTGARF